MNNDEIEIIIDTLPEADEIGIDVGIDALKGEKGEKGDDYVLTE